MRSLVAESQSAVGQMNAIRHLEIVASRSQALTIARSAWTSLPRPAAARRRTGVPLLVETILVCGFGSPKADRRPWHTTHSPASNLRAPQIPLSADALLRLAAYYAWPRGRYASSPDAIFLLA